MLFISCLCLASCRGLERDNVNIYDQHGPPDGHHPRQSQEPTQGTRQSAAALQEEEEEEDQKQIGQEAAAAASETAAAAAVAVATVASAAAATASAAAAVVFESRHPPVHSAIALQDSAVSLHQEREIGTGRGRHERAPSAAARMNSSRNSNENNSTMIFRDYLICSS